NRLVARTGAQHRQQRAEKGADGIQRLAYFRESSATAKIIIARGDILPLAQARAETLDALIVCCLLFPMALGPELHWPLWLQ
ncbi:hypothetical protein ACHWGL_32425, partial [Klebsiella pneumoniae]|uniref:hypothetical protein n=1 Tax=Klebsiella pneumoniae TaxID=573 RepID=UPI00376F1414